MSLPMHIFTYIKMNNIYFGIPSFIIFAFTNFMKNVINNGVIHWLIDFLFYFQSAFQKKKQFVTAPLTKYIFNYVSPR